VRIIIQLNHRTSPSTSPESERKERKKLNDYYQHTRIAVNAKSSNQNCFVFRAFHNQNETLKEDMPNANTTRKLLKKDQRTFADSANTQSADEENRKK
jgi:hypothetical protein